MREHLLVVASVLSVSTGVAVPTPAVGQVADTLYVGHTHSALASGLLEVLFPTAGFAYAGDWKRGFLPDAFRVAALLGFEHTADGPRGDVCEGEDACRVFVVAVVATTVWSVVGAVQAANDHNATVRELESRILVGPSPTGGGVSLGFRLLFR
jgi:hypothetical protein